MTLPAHVDVAIVGSGPAGLAAAIRLKALGIDSVTVLERDPTPGGVPQFCAHSPYGLREFHRLMRGPAYARRLVAQALAAGVTIHAGVTVTALHPGPRLSLTTPAGPTEITATRVLLATGVREASRVVRRIGGTKPGGILTTGALQRLVALGQPLPFRNPVILGTELVAFSAIMTCRSAGVTPSAMITRETGTTARWPTGLFPRLLGIPVHHRTSVAAINGRDRVTSVTLDSGQEMATDGVILTGQFRPDAALIRDSHLDWDDRTGGPVTDQTGRCSDPAYFAAGNLLRPVETAGWCWAEGGRIAESLTAPARATVPIHLNGDALAYVTPQRLAPGLPARLQLRVNRPWRGQLIVGATAHKIDSRPERRILIPVPALPDGATDITITLRKDA
mgnify:CR=1 FL=1